MWKCAVCDAEIEDDTWQQCWSCMTDRDMPAEEAQQLKKKLSAPIDSKVQCLRCDYPMNHAGTRQFHEGSRWGALGDLGELFVNRETFDVYYCPKCGKVEFFVDGIGESLR